ncbi:MAG: hypothetical protein ABIO05_00380, partial [Ferruginibacter sp.]
MLLTVAHSCTAKSLRHPPLPVRASNDAAKCTAAGMKKNKNIMIKDNNKIKEMVKEKYASIARQLRQENAASCCGATCCSTDEVYNIMADD